MQLQQRDQILSDLKQNLIKAQNRMKRFADKKRVEVSFNVHDHVFVKLQPYRQHSVALRKHQKLSMRYFGPFPITHRIGTVAYRLELPESAKIHPVFHVSMLKRFEGPVKTPYVPLPLLTEPEGPLVQPELILAIRTIDHHGTWVQQVQVKWDGLPEPTWELATDIQEWYPHFDLEDKVKLLGEGNVMGPIETPMAQETYGLEGKTEVRKSTRTKRMTWKLRE